MSTNDRLSASKAPSSNRLESTQKGGKMVKDYWDRLFSANERGAKVVWYNGSAVNPLFQAAGLEYCHSEAYAARMAALHEEGPAQRAGEEYGFINEVCSYARTTLGCAVLSQESARRKEAVGSMTDGERQEFEARELLASRLPLPDIFVNSYAGCSTGQQWDEISYRLFDKKLPFFKVSYPLIWGNNDDAEYLKGEEWEEASKFVVKQLHKLIEFLEVQSGRKFDWEGLREAMYYIKRAGELRLEAMELCRAKPAPAVYWDWIASIAPINFLPGNQELVDYFEAVKKEIEQRLVDGTPAIPNEKYRLIFDGFMNWNRVGWLANKFAKYDVAVMAGRYTHSSFWNEPQLIDVDDPLMGIAQHYLLCPFNHHSKFLKHTIMKECRDYDADGIVFHATRTCRSSTNGQMVMAQIAKEAGLQTMSFEGDTSDESFFKDAMFENRLEAMLEGIDAKRERIF
ncbi:MAG: 2-hydroxyacyl-CoA dehydratase family protein [Porticoccaceae bacterium]|nr:2-hydroxyacyl-CoA dehydratase [Pseudomonadales bacterium]MCP5171125.1 2-hydroxyacyl-CoA dehydratase [Pseudomonadales bacterium]MCP5301638.1 2-hydroxyacyl-CoA dehydratase [Pseudomonadales bacterium]